MSPPSLTVLMSVFNGEAFLQSSVESILAQTHNDFRFVLIDDGSVDETPSMLEAFAALDDRVRVIHNQTNMGLTRSLKKGLSQIQSDLVARMDCDDVSLPGRFRAQVSFLEANPDTAMVGVAWKEMSPDLGTTIRVMRPPTQDRRIRQKILAHNVFCHSAVMIRREPLLAVGGYDERDVYSQDYDLWLRIMARYRVANLEEVHHLRRVHPENLSNQNIRSQLRTMARAQRQYIRESELSPATNRYVIWRLFLSTLPLRALSLLSRLNQRRNPF